VWTNPRYRELTGQEPPGRATAEAVEPSGENETLATFPRRAPGGGPEQRLQVDLAEYQGNAYISIRVWEKGRGGRWYPLRNRGCSVRLSEALGVAAALREALVRAGQEAPRGRGARPDRRPSWARHGYPPAPGGPPDEGDPGY
jgi:hypothetical protein